MASRSQDKRGVFSLREARYLEPMVPVETGVWWGRVSPKGG